MMETSDQADSSNRIKMICLDLDGTTLDNHHKLSEKTLQTLRMVSLLGVTIAIVTGRSRSSVVEYVQILDLHIKVPIICHNGSYCFLTGNDKPIFATPVVAELAKTLIDLASGLNLVTQVRI